jgi:hypothetical protein
MLYVELQGMVTMGILLTGRSAATLESLELEETNPSLNL